MLTLVLITAHDCGGCRTLKNTGAEEAIEKEMAFMKDLDMIVITLNSMRDDLDPKYPRNLENHRKWYPIFLLFKTSDWDLGLPDGCEVRAYKGKFEDGQITYIGGPPASPSRIRDWATSSISDLFSVKSKPIGEKVEEDVKREVLPAKGKTDSTEKKERSKESSTEKKDNLIFPTTSSIKIPVVTIGMPRYADALGIDKLSITSTDTSSGDTSKVDK